MEKIRTGKAKTLIVFPQAGLRAAFSSGLRTLGFDGVQAVPSIKDALAVLETEDIDWIVTPLCPTEPVNGLQLLSMIKSEPLLEKVKVSFLLSPDDLYVVGFAHTLGLLSWHAAPVSADGFAAFIKELHGEIVAAKGNRTLLSSAYARRKLIADSNFAPLELMEKSLVEMLPGSLDALTNLASAQIRNGKYSQARSTLWLVAEKGGRQNPSYVALMEKLAASPDAAAPKPLADTKILFICEPDEAARAIATKCAQDLGCPEVVGFSDGDACWGAIHSGKVPDVIISEWKMPKVSGLQLLQRLRGASHHSTLVVVTSSLVAPKDVPILREMTVASVLPKPYGQNDLSTCLSWIGNQIREPSDPRMLSVKIRNQIRSGKIAEAQSLLSALIGKTNLDNPFVLEMCAEIALVKGDLNDARDKIVKSLKKSPGQVTALNTFGKVLLQQGQCEDALKILEQAQLLSPENVDRLCAIAETRDNLGDGTAASAAMEKANSLDKGNEAVLATKMNMALSANDLDSAKKSLGSVVQVDVMLRFMNNKAIVLSRAGKLVEAVALYENALKVLPSSETSLRLSIQLNIAFAKLRAQDIPAAQTILEQLKSCESATVKEKAKRIFQQVAVAHAAGKPVKFADQSAVKAVDPDKDVLGIIARGGEEVAVEDSINLAVFPRPEAQIMEKLQSLVGQIPRFKPRRKVVNGMFVA